MKPINLFEPVYRVDECLAALQPVLESGWLMPGPFTERFEAEWKAYTKLPHAHLVSSATAGLHLALEVRKRRWQWPSDGLPEVITTPLTFVSTNHAILHAGLKPVFADVSPHTLCLHPDAIRAAITPRTRAVMYVGLGGSCGEQHAVRELCEHHGLDLILDAAHMAGSRIERALSGPMLPVQMEHAGHGATVSVFSFQTVKNLPTGDGGMVCFRAADDDRLARQLSWLGIDKSTHARVGPENSYRWQYDVPNVGFKYAGNSIVAALGMVALKYLDRDNAYRRQIAEWYSEHLFDLEVDHMPDSSRHLYQIRLPQRDQLLAALAAEKIYAGVHYRYNGDYPMYADQPDCPNARQAASELLSLPMHLNLSYEDVQRVIKVVTESRL